ncbi:MAG: isoleucine--tRNA ligase [Patescibacteria group bacterium]|nr:isoleucine--tRNA ligase [Patescibacteria group bacterium]
MENNFIENEHKILKFWQDMGLLGRIKEKNKQGKPWSFLDGPITANNPMGVHHAWGRTLKDLFPRYKAMQGYEERFQNGFDCQGLWLEVEVEKELGFKSKKDIEQFGIEKFVNKCKERAHKYSKIQTGQSIRLGMLKDWGDWQTEFDENGDWLRKSHSYYTMSPENNYAIWNFLKKCQGLGLLYKGRDSVPWCPRCGTAISQHEILQEEYKEITHKTVVLKLPVVNQPNTYFLAWTTTPWSIPGTIALMVNPDFDYVKAEQEDSVYILSKERISALKGTFKIIEEFKGKELIGKTFSHPCQDFPALKGQKFPIIPGKEFVTNDIGTGIVTDNPGVGHEDYLSAKEAGLLPVESVDGAANFLGGYSWLSGRNAKDEKTIEDILGDSQTKGFVYDVYDFSHRYPVCWRCKAELIFRVVDEWYVSMDKLRESLARAVEKINWLPGFCRDRELDWLRNMQDWLISKKRYWGLALPIWECECGNFEVIGSLEELKEKAVSGWADFEGHSPHRPWIDAVKIKCSKCDKTISRIADVGNVWLDAGIVPFSTISDDNRSENLPYFHNSKEEWQKWFPVDLVCESFPGQFKNWFYVLLVMSQVFEDRPPFKNLLGFASVVDEKGEEMHKSKGNAIWFDEAVEKIGADVMRWMYVRQNPADNMRFGYNAARETERKILTLTNCVKFFETYVSNEKLKIKNEKPQSEIKNLLDKWVLSKLNNLIKTATEHLDKFDTMCACSAIEDFWIGDLSLWYVRRSRKRFQSPESQKDKEQAEQTFYYVLLALAKLIAPMMPFLAEEIYQSLLKINREDPSGVPEGSSLEDLAAESVHLCEYPQCDEKMVDGQLEREMEEIRNVVSLALAKRIEAGIGVRQALNKLKIKSEKLKIEIKNSKLLELVKDEVNVKEIVFDDKIEGDIELDTVITDELKQEGLAREIIRHIQDLRKKAGLTPQDKIDIYYSVESELAKIIQENQDQILEITRAEKLQASGRKPGEFLAQKEAKINGQMIWLVIEKV